MAVVLRVIAGAGEGAEHAIDRDLILGRDGGSADLVLPDSGISRRHARVFIAEGVPVIEDLGSSNGTYLNDRQLTQAVELVPGDQVQLGSTVLEVTDAGAPPEPPGPGGAAGAGALAPPPQPAPAPRRPEPAPRRLAPGPMSQANIPALASAFLGPLSILLVIFSSGAAFFVSLPCAIGASVLASLGQDKLERRESGSNRSFVAVGRATGRIGTILSIGALIAFVLVAVLLGVFTDSLGGILHEIQDTVQNP